MKQVFQGIWLISTQWLLFLTQLPAAPSSARVALWRRLRAAGATGMLNGSWVLPLTQEHQALFEKLAETVRMQGGSATVFSTTATTQADQDAIVARFRADRAREYDEFAERARAFVAEIDRETRQEKFTFAELEELEDDLHKLTGWLGKIRARDFFADARLEEAAGTLEVCGKALRAFAETVYAQEGLSSWEDDPGPAESGAEGGA